MSDSTPPDEPRRSLLRTAMKWGERVVLALLLLFAIHRLGPQLSAWTGLGPIEGSTPEYQVTLFDGSTLTSDDLRGKVVVLNVWATWCGPCRIEIPALQALHDDLGDEVVVLGLSTDIAPEGAVESWLAERSVDYLNGRLDGATRRALGGISHTPTTFVIDPDGVVHHKVLGLFAPPAMRAAVSRLQREASSAISVPSEGP